MEIFSKKIKKDALAVMLFIGVSLCLQLFTSPSLASKETLEVWVFDVGQGDAIFINAPEMQILIDGGGSSVILEKLTAVMPFWDRSIDLVVNTHPHADHYVGLISVLERYDVDEVWTTGLESRSEAFHYFKDLTESESSVFKGEVEDDYSFDLGSGVMLEVIWPGDALDGQYFEDPNDASITTLLTYGDTTILLTGDIGVEQEVEILNELEHVDVLKVGHHGSRTSTSVDLLKAITPDYAIISLGENSYGHPHEVVLDRLNAFGSIILRTDLDGDVRIATSGEEPSLAIFDL
jgi:competence protein ComEC